MFDAKIVDGKLVIPDATIEKHGFSNGDIVTVEIVDHVKKPEPVSVSEDDSVEDSWGIGVPYTKGERSFYMTVDPALHDPTLLAHRFSGQSASVVQSPYFPF